MTNESDLTIPKFLIPDSIDIYNCQNKGEQASASYTQITSSNANWILPIPDSLNYESDYSWSEEDTSWTGTAINRLVNGNFSDAGDAAANRFLSNIRGFIQHGIGASDSTTKMGLKTAGVNYNPNKQLYFNEVQMRQFSLSFSLSPLSREDAEHIKTGFAAISRSAAPGTSLNEFFFTYPDLFNLLIKTNGTVLMSRKSLAITQTSLDMTSDGQLTWHNDGFPTTMQFNITFMESVIPTKNNLSNITLFGKSL